MPLKDLEKFSVKHLQILNSKGDLDAKLDPKLSDEDLMSLYGAMLLARRADERQLNLQRQGRMGTFGPCTGQEAVSCGTAFAMSDQDWFVGSYRDMGARLMRGVKLSTEYLFWNGYEEGNVSPEAPRTLPNTVIVGSQCLHAVGIGYAMKYRKEKSAVVTFFGDGATSQGDFHEALNYASVWETPVIFMCVNNQWAISVPREKQTKSKTIAQKGIAYDIPSLQIDGNDVLAVYKAVSEALERAHNGGGPSFIEAVTYRLKMHTTADDPTKYRSTDEEKEWWEKDPLPRFEKYLEEKGLWSEQVKEKLEARIKAEVDHAVAELETPRTYKLDAPFDHVFGTTHDVIEDQRAEFLANVKAETGESEEDEDPATTEAAHA
jgi:pyruvate dehydrogenase E1 component alpha subunit